MNDFVKRKGLKRPCLDATICVKNATICAVGREQNLSGERRRQPNRLRRTPNHSKTLEDSAPPRLIYSLRLQDQLTREKACNNLGTIKLDRNCI